jgi:acyl CoA:acetate/3-ketoacid CoA transferase beta subunit
LAVIEVSPSGLTVIDIVPGLGFEKLQQLTAAKLVYGVN